MYQYEEILNSSYNIKGYTYSSLLPIMMVTGDTKQKNVSKLGKYGVQNICTPIVVFYYRGDTKQKRF